MRYLLLLFTCCLFFATPLNAALTSPAAAAPPATFTTADLSRDAMEAKLGRKLKFTERVALSIVRKKAKKQARKGAGSEVDGTVLDVPSLLSMIFGILAIITIFFGTVAILFAIAALVLGIVGLGRVNRFAGYRKGKGFAIAGIALGGGFIFFALIAIALFIVTFN